MISENNPVMGGGHYECSKCGETVFGSALHHCATEEEIDEAWNNAATQMGGYKEETWQDIFDEWTDNGIQEDNYAINFLNYLKDNFEVPKRK